MRHLYIPTMSNKQIRTLAANALESMTNLYFTIRKKYPEDDPIELQDEKCIPLEDGDIPAVMDAGVPSFAPNLVPIKTQRPAHHSFIRPGTQEYYRRIRDEPRFEFYVRLCERIAMGCGSCSWRKNIENACRRDAWVLEHNGTLCVGMVEDGVRSKCVIRNAWNNTKYADDYNEDFEGTPDTYEWKIMRGEIIENLEQDRYDYWKDLTHNLAKLNIDWSTIPDREARKLIEENGAWCLIHKDRICVGIQREGCLEHCIINNIRESMDLVPTSEVHKMGCPESLIQTFWKYMTYLPGH